MVTIDDGLNSSDLKLKYLVTNNKFLTQDLYSQLSTILKDSLVTGVAKTFLSPMK